MRTSFEFEYQGHKVRAKYEKPTKLDKEASKLFSFLVLKGGAWAYQGTMSFPAKAPKKQIIENVAHLSYFSG